MTAIAIKDLLVNDVPEQVRTEITFHPVDTMDEVLAIALEPVEEASAQNVA